MFCRRGAVTPEELLFTDKAGKRLPLHDVIYDGLDENYSARHGELARLIETGTPDQRLDAATMLASWGVPAGFAAIATWARDPEKVPWAGDPVSVDRFSGADSAWELLADTVRISGEIDHRSADSDAARDRATRAMLGIYDRRSFGRSLMTVFDLDRPLAGRVAKEIGAAVDRTVAAVKDTTEFDLATQAAWLIGGLAMVDDEHAAMASQALIEGHAGSRHRTRMLKELAYSLGFGTGPYTKAVLEALASAPSAGVQAEAREALGRRGNA